MSFDRHLRKQEIVSEISIKCDQPRLCMFLANQITEFLEAQYLQNELRDENDLLYAQMSKEGTD